LSTAELGLKANPVRPATVPKAIKIAEKPPIKLSECRNRGIRILAILASYIAGPYRLARYTGTIGSTHGERKDNKPALRATTIDIFSGIILQTTSMLVNLIYSITYLVEISSRAESINLIDKSLAPPYNYR